MPLSFVNWLFFQLQAGFWKNFWHLCNSGLSKRRSNLCQAPAGHGQSCGSATSDGLGAAPSLLATCLCWGPRRTFPVLVCRRAVCLRAVQAAVPQEPDMGSWAQPTEGKRWPCHFWWHCGMCLRRAAARAVPSEGLVRRLWKGPSASASYSHTLPTQLRYWQFPGRS